MIAVQILAVLALVIFGVIFSGLAVSLGKLPMQGKFGLGEIGAVFAGVVLTLVLHELTHGLVMQMFGARPKYGILWTRADVACHVSRICLPPKQLCGHSTCAIRPHQQAGRSGHVVIAGNLLGTLIGDMWNLNASGAIGDMWMTMIVLRYAAQADVMRLSERWDLAGL